MVFFVAIADFNKMGGVVVNNFSVSVSTKLLPSLPSLLRELITVSLP